MARQTDHGNESGTGNTDNVILLPKTMEFYQYELTRMLEQERYGEAIKLLRFLISCRAGEEREMSEWQALLQWLEEHQTAEAFEEAEETEADMATRVANDRLREDHAYIEKLVHTLRTETSVEKQFLALEQLGYMKGRPDIDEALVSWLSENDLHPLIQYRVLVILKAREYKEEVSFQRGGETIEVSALETPVQFEQFPGRFMNVLDTVRKVSEVNQPALFFFSEQLWKSFAASVYGSKLYREISDLNEEGVRIWAAALHHESSIAMNDDADTASLRSQYEIRSEALLLWERACREIRTVSSLN